MDSTAGALPARTRTPRRSVEIVSIHAPASDQSPEERVISMTDAERILLKATLKQTETQSWLDEHRDERSEHRLAAWQVIGIVFAILTGLILAGAALYSTFYGLSHSVLAH